MTLPSFSALESALPAALDDVLRIVARADGRCNVRVSQTSFGVEANKTAGLVVLSVTAHCPLGYGEPARLRSILEAASRKECAWDENGNPVPEAKFAILHICPNVMTASWAADGGY